MSNDAGEDTRNIHAFFTHAAMVARCFIPARSADKRAGRRADFLSKLFQLDLAVLQTCLGARHDLDHFDERIDSALASHSASIVTSFCIYVPNMARVDKIADGRPLLAQLIYLSEDHAVVTYSRGGAHSVTPFAPIVFQLQRISVWHMRYVDAQQSASSIAEKAAKNVIPREE